MIIGESVSYAKLEVSDVAGLGGFLAARLDWLLCALCGNCVEMGLDFHRQ